MDEICSVTVPLTATNWWVFQASLTSSPQTCTPICCRLIPRQGCARPFTRNRLHRCTMADGRSWKRPFCGGSSVYISVLHHLCRTPEWSREYQVELHFLVTTHLKLRSGQPNISANTTFTWDRGQSFPQTVGFGYERTQAKHHKQSINHSQWDVYCLILQRDFIIALFADVGAQFQTTELKQTKTSTWGHMETINTSKMSGSSICAACMNISLKKTQNI